MDFELQSETLVELFVGGSPIAQPRHRHRIAGKPGRQFVALFLPTKHAIHAWKQIILTDFRLRANSLGLGLIDYPVAVDLSFVLRRPKTKTRKTLPNPRYWKDKKPDIDNLQKAVLDALNEHAWHDDALICAGHLSAFIAGDGDRCGVAIRIRRLPKEVVTWADHLICETETNLF